MQNMIWYMVCVYMFENIFILLLINLIKMFTGGKYARFDWM